MHTHIFKKLKQNTRTRTHTHIFKFLNRTRAHIYLNRIHAHIYLNTRTHILNLNRTHLCFLSSLGRTRNSNLPPVFTAHAPSLSFSCQRYQHVVRPNRQDEIQGILIGCKSDVFCLNSTFCSEPNLSMVSTGPCFVPHKQSVRNISLFSILKRPRCYVFILFF